jgi:hypothetical protein
MKEGLIQRFNTTGPPSAAGRAVVSGPAYGQARHAEPPGRAGEGGRLEPQQLNLTTHVTIYQGTSSRPVEGCGLYRTHPLSNSRFKFRLATEVHAQRVKPQPESELHANK